MKKKTLFYCLLALLSFTFVLPACGDDDEEDAKDHALSVTGEYNGTISVLGNDKDGSVLIERTAKNQVSLNLDGFTVNVPPSSSIELGDISVEGLTVSKNPDGSYKLEAENQMVTVEVNGDPTPVPITVNGNCQNGNLDLTVIVNGYNIQVNFSGELVTDENV
jgi:hypothetical protein